MRAASARRWGGGKVGLTHDEVRRALPDVLAKAEAECCDAAAGKTRPRQVSNCAESATHPRRPGTTRKRKGTHPKIIWVQPKTGKLLPTMPCTLTTTRRATEPSRTCSLRKMPRHVCETRYHHR